MRLVVGLFAMFLTASVARADEANSPDPKAVAPRAKVSLRVVKLLPESHQALLFDRNRGTHVLAEVGGTIDGYKVEDIDDDEVTLSVDGKEIVLTAPAPDPSWRRGRGAREAEPTRAKAPTKAATAPRIPTPILPSSLPPALPARLPPARLRSTPTPRCRCAPSRLLRFA